ncbi:glycoside hydrolase family 38 protein [Rhizopogon salebrosus TDB-379]|nr:glycoside hydrolase family 38 protein [Rhizopogon salebrosus TDB-379]
MCSHNHNQDYPELNYGTGAKWIKSLTQNRLSTFLGGHFEDVNLSSVLFTHRIDGPNFVDLKVWSAPGLAKPSFREAMKHEFKPAKKGDSFGPSCNSHICTCLQTNHWWKVTLKIPSYWQQYERVQFEFDPGCEAMIFSTDGVPLQGITGGYGGDRRVEHIVPPKAVRDGHYSVVIESSCNGMFGVPWNGDTIAPPDMNRYFSLASADLVVPNQDAWHLMWDFATLREIAETLPGNTVLQNKALVTANKIMNAFKSGDAENVHRMRGIAEDVFGKGWQAKGDKIYKEGPKSAQVVGISYCHIDTAWLWPYSVTQQKTARSWSTQIDLMERYPEHRFACSQAQQFKWLEEQYPPLFERIKKKVASGQFHLIGGSWVENDGNMPSGEALVRQFLYGQRYFESRFGKRCDTAWLPDSFGLTAAYPQLIREAGMKYFFTQKNRFPHSTFNWVGIDGSQVLCHMTPKLYAEVREVCTGLLEEAFGILFPQSSPLLSPSKCETIVAFNPTSFERHDVVKVPLSGNARLKAQVVQASSDGKYGYALMHSRGNGIVAQPTGMFANCAPASGMSHVLYTNGTDHFVLRNNNIQLTITEGRIRSLIDVKLGRELIPKGRSGGLVIFEDRPNYWDAWDVEIHHLETPIPLSFSQVRVIAEGPLRVAVQTKVKYGKSTIDITVPSTYNGSTATVKSNSRSFFNFDAVVDWHEKHKFLKFELPLDINNTHATYESQFGYVQRPTHKNTTIDAAQFEVCGHKFADLSEYGYGVAFLSESKYGFACEGNVLRISLLRSATAPDADQDQGKHEFSWAVMPHVGSFLESDVPNAGFIYNSPLHVRTVPGQSESFLTPSLPFWLEGTPNVFLETVKRGEDDFEPKASGTTVILRMYESFGGHGSVKLHLGRHFPVKRAYITNILEDTKGELGLVRTADGSSTLKLEFRGFEVKTVKLVLGSKSSDIAPTT